MSAVSRSLKACLVLLSATASMWLIAQPEAYAKDPTYKVAVYDVTAKSKDSAKVTPVLIKALKEKEELELLVDDDAEDALKPTKMSTKDWRSDKTIKKNKKRISEGLKKSGVDAVALIEVQKRGKIMVVTLLDREGQELKTFRGGLSKKRLKSDQADKAAGAILSLIQKEIEPSKPPEEKKPSTNVALIEEEPTPAQTPEPSAAASTAPEVSSELDAPELLDDQIILDAGLVMGRRNLSSTSETVELTHVAPFIGPMIQLLYTSAIMDGDAQIGVSANFSYSPFNTEATDTEGNPVSLSSSFMRGGATARFHYGLLDSFALGVYGGLDYMVIAIDPNEFYTGHRYISARTGLSALISPTEGLYISLEGGVLPYVNGQYQTPANETAKPSPLGFEGGGSLALRLTSAVEARLLYQLTYMGPTDSDPAEASDTIHQGGLMIGYGF